MQSPKRPGHPWRRSIAALLGAFLLWTAEAQPVRTPAPGVLLVAGESMGDPRFRQTVLLIIEHDRSGSQALVINKPTPVEVGEVLPSMETPDGASRVYYGGPVQLNRLSFLYRGDEGAGTATGLRGVRWSHSQALLKEKLAEGPDRVRVYAGYAGWAPGQLEFELARGGWRMIQGRAENVFNDHPQRLWRRLTDALEGLAI